MINQRVSSQAEATLSAARADLIDAMVRGGATAEHATRVAAEASSLDGRRPFIAPGQPGSTWGALRAGCRLRALVAATRNQAVEEE